ncbi:MAG: hypothetical protein EA397_15555 [Deltaproteobacteria bacterium]|nr:MAG: hypothetical protein EA397_15555 [Deltaproteobacteria bacterium]
MIGRTLCFSFALALAPSGALATTIAVMEFDNATDDLDWAPLGKGFQEMFLVDLDKAESLQTVPRQTLREQALALNVPRPADSSHRRALAERAGASHLLYGSFRVDGQEMSLRVELLDTANDRVIMKEVRTGEAEAFFELQKDVLQASIGALELDLSARERAETGRLHTADFLAFQDFSRGLDLFDAQRYEASLTALRSATERDVQFGLAQLTLKAYEELIAQTRQKAQAIHAVRTEERRLQRLQAAGEEVEVIRRLLQVARREGPQHTRLRLAALHTLAVAYSNVGRRNGLRELPRIEDRFALARAADQLWARYHTEALKLWPALPLQPSETFYRGMPRLDHFDEDLERNAKTLWERGADHPENRRNDLLSNLRQYGATARALHLSMADQVALHDTFLELAVQLEPSETWMRYANDARLKEYRQVLRFDDATRLLESEASRTENEWKLRSLAKEMETNRDFVAFLQNAGQPQIAQEWLHLGLNGTFGPSSSLINGRRHFMDRALSAEARHLLTRARRTTRRGYLLLDETPLWSHHPNNSVSTGPRSDARRTTSLRYYQQKPDILAALFYGGAEPLSSPSLRTTLSFRAPDDFQPHRDVAQGLVNGRPEVGLLFGLEDLDVPLQTTAEAEQRRIDPSQPRTRPDRELTRPMTGYMLRIRDRRAELLRIVEAERGSFDRKERFDEELLESASLRRSQERIPIELKVQGDAITIHVGGTKIRARLPSAPHGFIGLWIQGQGFVEVEGMALSGQPEG